MSAEVVVRHWKAVRGLHAWSESVEKSGWTELSAQYHHHAMGIVRVYAAGMGYARFVTAECSIGGVHLHARIDGCFSFDHAAMGRLFRRRVLPALEVAGRERAGLWAMDCETAEGRAL